jgi:hypothetical protein
MAYGSAQNYSNNPMPRGPPPPSANMFNAQREQNLKLEGFQQLDETSEYRETQYFKSSNGNSHI